MSELHDAVLRGDELQVLRLLEEGHDINRRDSNGNTPLLLAACIKDESVYVSIVRTLVQRGADVDTENKGITPLRNAVFYRNQSVVEMLLAAGAQVGKGYLPHAAARDGSKEILRLLLDKGTVIDEEDDRGRTPAYIAALHGHRDCLEMLIERGADLSKIVDGEQSVMDVVFEQIAAPVKFLLRVLDSKIKVVRSNEKNRYFANFSVLGGHQRRQMDVISSLVVAANSEEKTEVFQHPLIELYLTLKWAKICYFFYLWIAAYVVFVFSMSVYVTMLTQGNGAEGVATATRWILIVSATCLLGHGVLQCWLTHRNHFRKYEMWLNLACTSLSLLVAVVTGDADDMPNWVLHLTSVAVLLSWLELMLLIGRLPTYGYYALMFSAVLQNVIRVLLAFLCLVVGFALSFSIQFRTCNQFRDPWVALVKTTVMMMGEFEYGDLFAEPNPEPIPRLVFLMFIILTSIVLMNLMVGLAVSDIQSLQTESHARKLEKQADFLAQVEKVITSDRLKKRVPRVVKKVLRNCFIDNCYELKTSAQFRRSKKLPSKLIDSLVVIAKSHREKNDCES